MRRSSGSEFMRFYTPLLADQLDCSRQSSMNFKTSNSLKYRPVRMHACCCGDRPLRRRGHSGKLDRLQRTLRPMFVLLYRVDEDPIHVWQHVHDYDASLMSSHPQGHNVASIQSLMVLALILCL